MWYYADGSGLILKTYGMRYFSFQINNYVPPTKKEIKEHYKNKEWFEYVGTVTYYVNDACPDALSISRRCGFVIPDTRHDKIPPVEKKSTATIRIAPYKRHPSVYNIFFDGIGVGIEYPL